MSDAVNHPSHYRQHPSGVECIEITEHMSFCVGNAIKYLWRADLKGAALEDLEKARWYVAREISRRKNQVRTARYRAKRYVDRRLKGRCFTCNVILMGSDTPYKRCRKCRRKNAEATAKAAKKRGV